MDRELIDDCEARFAELSERFGGGDLTEQQFQGLVEELRVQDLSGTWWRLSPVSGNWCRLDGDRWTEGGRPTDAASPAGLHPARQDIELILPEPPETAPPRGAKGCVGQVFRYLLGALLMAYGVGQPLLGWVGDRANGVVTSISRSDSTEDGRSESIAISYDFTLADGRTVSGLSTKTTRRFGRSGVSEGQPIIVRFVPGVPYLNAASWDTEPSVGHLLVAAVGFAIVAPLRWLRRGHRRKAA